MTSTIIVTASLRDAIDLYWLAMVHVRNILEDVEGSDGRIPYLLGLRYKLLVVAKEMDAIIGQSRKILSSRERYAQALSEGLPNFGWDETALATIAGISDVHAQTDYHKMREILVNFANAIVDRLPGFIPNAQGVETQRNVLTAMQRWQVIADSRGESLAFLEARFMDL